MMEDHVKLVAKVQHFYEIMISRNQFMLNDAIESNSYDKKLLSNEANNMSSLIEEYEKAFESFLYKENK